MRRLTTLAAAAPIMAACLALAGCGEPTAAPPSESISGADFDLVAELRAAGAGVTVEGTVSQPFFRPSGSLLRVNGGSVQAYRFESAPRAREVASSISADGTRVGGTSILWVDVPNFFLRDRWIVLYVGRDERVLTPLRAVLGEAFAGAAGRASG